MTEQVDEQSEPGDSFRGVIFSILARERQDAVKEALLTVVVYLFFATLVSLVTSFCLGVFLTLFLFRRGNRFGFSPLDFSPLLIGASALLILCACGVRQLLSRDFNTRRVSVWDTLDASNVAQPTVDIIGGLLLIGPRCGALAIFEIKKLVRLLCLDLGSLVDPIELAFLRRRKTLQRDLGEIDLEKFFDDVAWFKGVVRLHSPPVGFVLNEELRRELRGWRTREQVEEEAEAADEEPVNVVDEAAAERNWALGVLGLSGNPNRAEIKQAYRALAKKYHPDLRRGAGSDAPMKELNRAMEILNRAT